MRIYIVTGATGEYSDHFKWTIVGYLSEKLAKQHVSNALRRAEEIKKQYQYTFEIPPGINEFDPKMTIDREIEYDYYALEIVDVDSSDI